MTMENADEIPFLKRPESYGAILRARNQPFIVNRDVNSIHWPRVAHKHVVLLLLFLLFFLLALAGPYCSRGLVHYLLPTLHSYLLNYIRRGIP
jgi:hypothetical protein